MPKQTLAEQMAAATAATNGNAKPAKKATAKKAAPAKTPAAASVPAAVEEQVVNLPIDRIAPSPHNPRRSTGDLTGLKASIAEIGILEPLLVEADGDKFLLLAGWRRYTAADELGLATVPCIVRATPTDTQRIEIMLIENLQRADLEPLEEAEGYQALIDLGLSQHDIAKKVGCNQSHVSKRLQLLDLPPEVQAAVGKKRDAGGITIEEALELTKLNGDSKSQVRILKDAVRDRYKKISNLVDNQVRKIARDAKAAKEAQRLAAAGKKVVGVTPKVRGGKVIAKESWQPGLHLDATKHAKEPCHAIKVVGDTYARDGIEVKPVCLEPARHEKGGDSKLKVKVTREANRPGSAPVDEEAEAKRRAESEARIERIRLFLRDVLAKKVAAPLALDTLTGALLSDGSFQIDERSTLWLIGALEDDTAKHEDVERAWKAARASDAARLAVAGVLDCGVYTIENRIARTWGANVWADGAVVTLYAFLRANGYELDDTERDELAKAAAE